MKNMRREIAMWQVICDFVMAAWSVFWGVLLFMGIFEIADVWMSIETWYDLLMFIAVLVQGTYGSVHFIKRFIKEVVTLYREKREEEARTKREALKARCGIGLRVG